MPGREFGAALVAIALACVACGGSSSDDDDDSNPGSSGVDRNKYLDELDADEISALCTWAVNTEGGPGMRTCAGGISVDVPTVDECQSDAGRLHCKVGLTEDCVRSLAGNPCALTSTQSCADYVACVLNGS